jgi:hypothetical protein
VSPRLKVEIRFDGSTWVEVTNSAGTAGVKDYLLLASSIGINRGRSSEADDPVAPGTFSLLLDNRDGRFSPDLPSSPYYPHVTTDEGVAVRVSVYANGAWRRRAWGVVSLWAVSGMGSVPVCRVTATDALGTFPSYTLRQASDEVVRSHGYASVHWPIRDSSGPAQPSEGSAVLTANSGSGWGAGGLLPLDEGDAHPLFTSASGGLTLTSPLFSAPGVWSVGLALMAAPSGSCTILRLAVGGSSLNLTWTPGSGLRLGSGSYAMPSSWPTMVMVTADPDPEGPSVTLQAGSVAAYTASYPGALSRVVINPTLSGGATWSAGHLIIARGSLLYDSLSAELVDSRLMGTVRAPQWLLAKASPSGSAMVLSGVPYQSVALPLTDGRDAADVMAAMLAGMGARLRDDLDGGLVWVPLETSAAAVTIPGEYGTDLLWQTDNSGWMSSCTLTWPDGTTYTSSRADGPRRTGGGIEGVHATRAQDRSFADWLVNTASRGGRLPTLSVDTLGLTEAERATVCALTVGSRVALAGLPSQMPSALTCIVEGLDETIAADGWTVTFKLSPDVWARVGIYGTSTYDSGAIYAP